MRKAFVMSINPGCEAEYARRHQPIWPELKETLLAHGLTNYSIFLHTETSQLFAYVEFASEMQWQQIAQTEVCQRWWAHMRELMPTNPDNSPIVRELTEVFHIDSKEPADPMRY